MKLRFALFLLSVMAGSKAAGGARVTRPIGMEPDAGIPQQYVITVLAELVMLVALSMLILVKVRKMSKNSTDRIK